MVLTPDDYVDLQAYAQLVDLYVSSGAHSFLPHLLKLQAKLVAMDVKNMSIKELIEKYPTQQPASSQKNKLLIFALREAVSKPDATWPIEILTLYAEADMWKGQIELLSHLLGVLARRPTCNKTRALIAKYAELDITACVKAFQAKQTAVLFPGIAEKATVVSNQEAGGIFRQAIDAWTVPFVQILLDNRANKEKHDAQSPSAVQKSDENEHKPSAETCASQDPLPMDFDQSLMQSLLDKHHANKEQPHEEPKLQAVVHTSDKYEHKRQDATQEMQQQQTQENQEHIKL